MSPLSLADVIDARRAIATTARLTPVWPSLVLEAIAGVPVSLKCEQFQRAGSFKVRGALNCIRLLDRNLAPGGVVTASAGNHAQGVALAGTAHGFDVTVVMPVIAPLAKISAARGYGARVILHGASLAESVVEARAIAERESRRYVPPFDDDAVIAGQGTVGLEILEQAPGVREVLVPTGGGGLLAGVALAVKESAPNVKVIGVQSAAMDGVVRSMAAGSPVETPAARTMADGVAVAGPSSRTFDLIERYVDDVIAVPEEAIAHAVVLLLERAKMVVEGAGALGVAALISGQYRPSGSTVAILSGGNIDINLVGSIIRHGLSDAGRYQQLAVEVSDMPGELAALTTAIGRAGGNVLEVDHNREGRGLPIGVAIVDVVIEVNGPEHFELVLAALRDEGILPVDNTGIRLATASARTREAGWHERTP